MKRLISCASYYGSGSSAIIDLIGEYKHVKSLTNYEFRFIQDIDGLMDLEYHLVQNPNRHNSGHALKRFWNLSKFNAGNNFDKRYSRFLGKSYLDLTKDYVDALTDYKYNGYWFMDLYEKGVIYYYVKSIIGKIMCRLHLPYKKMPNEITYCSHPTENRFLELTRKYIQSIIEAANPEDYDYLLMDQLTPSSNINKCLRYFDESIRTIVVDRDPRDIFVVAKTVWKSGIVPSNVEYFCKWYTFTHGCAKGQEVDRTKVLHIHFEDLIYKYDETVSVIESFIDISPADHENQFKGMNPRRSFYNTNMFASYKHQEDIRYIERYLSEYLYDFEAVKNLTIKGVAPNSNKCF